MHNEHTETQYKLTQILHKRLSKLARYSPENTMSPILSNTDDIYNWIKSNMRSSSHDRESKHNRAVLWHKINNQNQQQIEYGFSTDGQWDHQLFATHHSPNTKVDTFTTHSTVAITGGKYISRFRDHSAMFTLLTFDHSSYILFFCRIQRWSRPKTHPTTTRTMIIVPSWTTI